MSRRSRTGEDPLRGHRAGPLLLAFGVLIGACSRCRPQVPTGEKERVERPVPVAPRFAVVPGLGRFVIRDPEDIIQAKLIKGRVWEPDAVPVFERYITPGMSVVDIGAYNGVHTVRFGNLVGSGGRVYAFEPNPPAYEMLTDNIKLNGLADRTTLYPYGVSDSPSSARVKLSDNPHNLGGTHLCVEEDVKDERLHCQNAREVEVKMIRVDDDVRRWFPTRVGFVKIDVEGNEDRVLAGSKRWLAEDRPVLCVEIWDDSKRAKEKLPTTAAELVAEIERLGYTKVEQTSNWDYVFVPTNDPTGSPPDQSR